MAFDFGGEILRATILEDRGPLGVHGEKIFWLYVDDPSLAVEERFEIELPGGRLLPVPESLRQ